MAEKQVTVRLTAKGGDRLKGALRDVGTTGDKGFARVSKAAERASRVMNGFARRLGRIVAIQATAMAGLATVMVRSSLRTIDEQAKLAQSLGTTVASMQVLDRAANLAGVSMGEVQQGTIQLTKRLSQAAAGGGPAADALDRIRLSATDLIAMPLDQRILTISDAIEQFIPVAEQAAVKGQLFGDRAGLIFSRVDSATLRQANDELARMGVLVTEIEADQIERANDALSRVGLAVRGVGNQMAVALAPHLEAIGTWLAENSRGIGEWVRSLADGVTTITRHFRAFGLRVQVVLLDFKAAWAESMAGLSAPVGDAVNALVGGFRGAFAAVKAIWSALPAVLGDLMIAGANAAIGAVESMLNGISAGVNRFITGINSAIDKLPERLRPGGRLGTIGSVDLPDVANPFAGAASDAGSAAADAFNEAFKEKVWDPDTANAGSESMRRAADMFRTQIADIMAGADGAAPAVARLGQAVSDVLSDPEAGDKGKGGGGSKGSAAADKIAEIGEAAKEAARKAEEAARAMSESIRETVEGVTGPIKDLFKGGQDSARSFADSVAQVLENMRDRIIDSVFKPIEDGLVKMFESSMSGGGGGIIGAILGAFGGGGGSAGGGIAAAVSGGIYHNGGIAGRPATSRRLPAATWAGAARYHTGGIAGLKPDEVPAILQRGETVWPRGSSAAGAASQQPMQLVVRLVTDNAAFQQQVVGITGPLVVDIVQQDARANTTGRTVAALRTPWARGNL